MSTEALQREADRPSPTLDEVIFRRRDVRREFSGQPADPAVLRRILDAAHAAPSVGMTQPWDFIVVTDELVRREFHRHVQHERDVFAATLAGEEAERFERIKVDGVLESSLSIVVTYDHRRGGTAVLGRHAFAESGLYSAVLAIQNLWLAATAEGWGVGWVSFYREPFLQALMGIPDGIRPIAWLCVGPVSHFESIPDLERYGWQERRPLEGFVHWNGWRGDGPALDRDAEAAPPLGGWER